MSDSYLDLAYKVLKAHAKPMTAAEILNDAARYGLLPSHLHGRTMHKTLQARLSEDIIKYRFKSQFYRTSPGRFFLRSFSSDVYINDIEKKEYLALSRKKPIRRQRVLCAPKRSLPAHKRINAQGLLSLLAQGDASYIPKKVADQDDTITQIMSFTVITCEDAILTHRAGRFTEHTHLAGTITVGFRSFITEFDIDLLNEDVVGARRNSARELARHFRSTRVVTDNELMEKMAFLDAINDPEHSLCAIVVRFECEAADLTKLSQSKALGVSRLSWSAFSTLSSMPLDTWSTLLVPNL